MDKLEHYLDRVCRGLGGSWAMRQHIRQELREHLRDAVAGHRAAGMTEEDALARALADFGSPDEVRSELEATHGQRLLAVVIDKAIEWKEKTMKAKWLWLSWAHLALAGAIAVAALAIGFSELFLVPKFRAVMRDGWLNPSIHEPGVAWLFAIVDGTDWVAENTTWIVLGAIGLWALFEWRVRGDNKTYMRLSAFGTAALALVTGVALSTGAMLVLLFLGMPGAVVGDGGRIAVTATAGIGTSLEGIDRALAAKDWESLREQVSRASGNLTVLAELEKRSPAKQSKVPQLTADIQTALASLHEAEAAIAAKDAVRFEAAVQRFRQAYATPRQWVKELKQ